MQYPVQVGEVVAEGRAGDCQVRRVSCELSPHDRPQLSTLLQPSGCCTYQGGQLRLGERAVLAEQCAWLVCREGGAGPELELVSSQPGCRCCQAGQGELHRDGARHGLTSHTLVQPCMSECCRLGDLVCHRGTWVRAVDTLPTPQVAASVVEKEAGEEGQEEGEEEGEEEGQGTWQDAVLKPDQGEGELAELQWNSTASVLSVSQPGQNTVLFFTNEVPELCCAELYDAV